MEFISDNKIELQHLNCRLDSITRSDGSAILSQGKYTICYCIQTHFSRIKAHLLKLKILFEGDTAVAVSISGPGEVKLHNLQIDKAHVEVCYRSKSGIPSLTDKLREKIIRETCESAVSSVLYPRSSIILQIHEMENTCGVSYKLIELSLNKFLFFFCDQFQ